MLTSPQLRFKEFTSEWSTHSSKIKIVAGNAYPLSKYGTRGALLVQGQNIFPNQLKIEEPVYIPDEYLNGNDVWISRGDILLGLNRPLLGKRLKTCQFRHDTPAVLYQRAGKLVFNTEKLVADFLYQYLFSGTFLRQLSAELVGSDQPYIKSDLFNVTKNKFPDVAEQQKIAAFLTAVDTKIEQLTQKEALLKQYKKGVMQKIFSQEIRFKADDGSEFPEWNLVAIGETVDKSVRWSLTGGPFGSDLKSADYTDEGVRIIQLQNIGDGKFLDDYAIYTSSEKADQLLACNIYAGEIIISKMGDPVARCCLMPETSNRYLMASDGIRYVPDSKFYNKEYLFQYINYKDFRKQAFENSTGSTRKRIGLSDLKALKISAPIKEEQDKIASFLDALDKSIDGVLYQLNAAKTFKKGLLQQMFV